MRAVVSKAVALDARRNWKAAIRSLYNAFVKANYVSDVANAYVASAVIPR